MSLQSDVEMLSVHAMEEYASRKHISGTDVMDLFHRYHVIEKIMIQHEYLHQVSFEEVMEFVEKTIEEATDKYYVYQCSFTEDSSLRIKRFDSLSEEWLEFIKENRANGGVQHDYDVVIGPVADDNTMETVQLYIAGILKVNEAVERLRYSQVNNQVSFHTEKALSFLKYMGRQCNE